MSPPPSAFSEAGESHIEPNPVDSYYLSKLLESINVWWGRARPSTHVSVIDLQGTQAPDAVEPKGGGAFSDALPSAFFWMLPESDHEGEVGLSTDLDDAFDKYDGRVLLLGEPGSGKTVTLMNFAERAARARLDDPKRPLPLLAPIATWDAETGMTLADWLCDVSKPLNDSLGRVRIEDMIRRGEAVLVLDGLDELKSEFRDEKTGETHYPRREFLKILPDDAKIVLSCRPKDYEDMGVRLALNGAVRLSPLTDGQKERYLSHYPGLLKVLRADETLNDLSSSPLFLSLLVFGFKGLEVQASILSGISKGELRDRLFGAVLKRRYEIESKKRWLKSGEQLVAEIDELRDVFGWVAMRDAGGAGNSNLFHRKDFEEVSAAKSDEIIRLGLDLGIISRVDETRFRFSHMLFRDYFAFRYAQLAVNSRDDGLRDRAAWALWQISDERAAECLIPLLRDPYKYARGSAAGALGRLGDQRAVEPLISLLNDEEPVVSIYGHRICEVAAFALTAIGTPRALSAVDNWKKTNGASTR